MGEVAERHRQSMIELRAQFPAAYAQLSGRRWRAFRDLIERERPLPPAVAEVEAATPEVEVPREDSSPAEVVET
jgi:indole-3-glycerol phosphate synthase